MVFDAAMTSILQNRIDTSGDLRALGAINKDPNNLSFSHMMVSLNATYSNTSSSHVVASLQAAVAFATTPLLSDSDSSLDAFVHQLDMMEKDFTDTKYSISEIVGFILGATHRSLPSLERSLTEELTKSSPPNVRSVNVSFAGT